MKLPLFAGIALASAVIFATVVAGVSSIDKPSQPDQAIETGLTDDGQTITPPNEDMTETPVADKGDANDTGERSDLPGEETTAPVTVPEIPGDIEDLPGKTTGPIEENGGEDPASSIPGDITDDGGESAPTDAPIETPVDTPVVPETPGQNDQTPEEIPETGGENQPVTVDDEPGTAGSGNKEEDKTDDQRPPVEYDDGVDTLADYFAKIALNELGVAEKRYNNVKYNTWYYGYEVVGRTSNSYAWCVVFISWCANEAGISTKYIPKTAGVASMRNFFINKGVYTTGSKGIAVGDIVFFGTKASSPTHAGIVVAIEDDGTIVTIEGNYSDKVSECRYAPGSKTILGYATPACF